MFIKILEELKKNYEFEEKDCGDFKELSVSGMTFKNSSFYAKGLGNVAIMNIDDGKGIMKMDTLIINPFEIDAPMLSYDCISMMGTNILYLEPFDTTINHDFNTESMNNVAIKYNEIIENNPQQERWYDSMRLPGTIFKKTTDTENLTKLLDEYYKAYISTLKETKTCDIELKKEKAATYSNGLIVNGGPATDPFLQTFGKEKTQEFFKQVLFGV